jgi:hypothetical protein
MGFTGFGSGNYERVQPKIDSIPILIAATDNPVAVCLAGRVS